MKNRANETDQNETQAASEAPIEESSVELRDDQLENVAGGRSPDGSGGAIREPRPAGISSYSVSGS